MMEWLRWPAVLYVVMCLCLFFFFNDTATTEIYTLSLHDALPISVRQPAPGGRLTAVDPGEFTDRSEEHTSELQSHSFISYAVFCLKKNTREVTRREHCCRTYTTSETQPSSCT